MTNLLNKQTLSIDMGEEIGIIEYFECTNNETPFKIEPCTAKLGVRGSATINFKDGKDQFSLTALN